ncbi:hypothetical protein BLA29_004957, partial [Euroglyphus maynei]
MTVINSSSRKTPSPPIIVDCGLELTPADFDELGISSTTSNDTVVHIQTPDGSSINIEKIYTAKQESKTELETYNPIIQMDYEKEVECDSLCSCQTSKIEVNINDNNNSHCPLVESKKLTTLSIERPHSIAPVTNIEKFEAFLDKFAINNDEIKEDSKLKIILPDITKSSKFSRKSNPFIWLQFCEQGLKKNFKPNAECNCSCCATTTTPATSPSITLNNTNIISLTTTCSETNICSEMTSEDELNQLINNNENGNKSTNRSSNNPINSNIEFNEDQPLLDSTQCDCI